MHKPAFFSTLSGQKWKKIGVEKRAGILVPLFSAYSSESLGIGDFGDMKLLIDFTQKTGNSILQLLPMNEVGSTFCPYDSISSFALEPMYISFNMLPESDTKPLQVKIKEIKKAFPCGKKHLDYKIKDEKIRLLKELFLSETENSLVGFDTFRQENAYWVYNYAFFKALKEYHHGSAWYEWEGKYKNRERAALESFSKEHEESIAFEIWVQWLLYSQFKEVKSYAEEKNVLLKGDLPILVSLDSADVWAHPEFFNLELTAGAPPDMYCEKGQRWGTPTYNWERIEADGYQYLKEKLRYAQNFYDILRIDHVIGLFRIWSIPAQEPQENKGLHGFFDPRDESKWAAQGRNLLTVILENTKMLLCAEDLGVVPRACTEALKEFGIPGNEVQRWVKDWIVKHDFLEPQDYRLFSVSMLSTHDTTNWAAWWENEAGTVDEALFLRKCQDRWIDYHSVKNNLFDHKRSRHGRLRWLDSITSVDILLTALSRKKEEVMDFIDLYVNTYREKEKLWKHLGIAGPMREKADEKIISKILHLTLKSNSIFAIQLLIDWLGITDLLKGDAYQYRINTPGTVNPQNWSLTLHVSLDDLLKDPVCRKIKHMVTEAGRF
ncbi:MAG: 4-alpha-glucanotransferase [Candidatus Omnitrophota bacterium]|jgi:4-alpha-glucanotransferase